MGWDRIRGHDAVRDQLVTAFRRGRQPHAYLFVGPPGVGKHLFAVEFAKALLCEHSPAPLTACDHCPACAQVDAATHPDFFTAHKPDDKHELPIDIVRAFCANLGLKPTRGLRKVGVLEDADEFNEESANCFLKTLEEPPPGAMLILLTTSTDVQLPTILSRCQVVRFRALPDADVRTVLEGRGVTDPARRERLVRLAAGSPGRAIALNDDELWAFRETILAAITAPTPDPTRFAAEFARFVEDAGKETAAQRLRASLVVKLLADLLRSALRLSVGTNITVESSEADKLQRLATRSGPDRITDWLDDCLEADYYIDRKVQLVLAIELLADKLCKH